jgi:hypothetical protein
MAKLRRGLSLPTRASSFEKDGQIALRLVVEDHALGEIQCPRFACEISWLARPCASLSTMTKKAPTKSTRTKGAARKEKAIVARGKQGVVVESDARFAEVVALIEAARGRAYQAVNAELVSL